MNHGHVTALERKRLSFKGLKQAFRRSIFPSKRISKSKTVEVVELASYSQSKNFMKPIQIHKEEPEHLLAKVRAERDVAIEISRQLQTRFKEENRILKEKIRKLESMLKPEINQM